MRDASCVILHAQPFMLVFAITTRGRHLCISPVGIVILIICDHLRRCLSCLPVFFVICDLHPWSCDLLWSLSSVIVVICDCRNLWLPSSVIVAICDRCTLWSLSVIVVICDRYLWSSSSVIIVICDRLHLWWLSSVIIVNCDLFCQVIMWSSSSISLSSASAICSLSPTSASAVYLHRCLFPLLCVSVVLSCALPCYVHFKSKKSVQNQ